MADREEKFPTRTPHIPCGPWPSVFPYDKDYPGDHPPHRPPNWHNWNDTEPVIGVYPWERCCDGDDDPCLCITSGEVDIWNQTYSAVSGHSADWDRAVDDTWKNSADNWQSSYETVSANSALWDSAYKIASAWDSGANESIYSIISATSAFILNYSAEPYIHVNEKYFNGNGTEHDPINLSGPFSAYLIQVDEAMRDLYSGGRFGLESNRKWVSKEVTNGLEKWIEYLNDLMWKVGPKTTSPDGNVPVDENNEPISNVGGIFYQLEKLWHCVGDSDGSYRLVLENSGNWNSVYNTVSSYSGSWNGISLEDSGHWTDTYHTVGEHSAYWDTAANTVSENSAAWGTGDDSWKNSADNWQSSYQTIKSDSGDWESTYDTVYENSGSWNSVHEAVETNSGSWNDTFATVTEHSASWANGSHETWEYAPDMTIYNYAQYVEEGKIYFNFRE